MSDSPATIQRAATAGRPDGAAPWYASRWFLTAAFTALAIVAAVEGYLAIFVRENDFVFHRNLGRAFLDGDPFRNSVDWYPLGRAMLNALPAAIDYRAARALCFGLALLALVGCWRMWEHMASRLLVVPRNTALAAGVFAAALTIPYLLRDLDECGLQIFLLFFLTAGACAVCRGRACQGGFWLGLAATYKITPLLCLPFLLWKRQWRAAGWMGAFVVLINLAPALYLGWDVTIGCHRQWLARMRDSARVVDPAMNAVEGAKPQNLSLPGALARYLETYPPGHSLYVEHPLFAQFGHLSAAAANRLVKACLLALAAILAWRYRRSWQSPGADAAAEWASVCALCALLAPVCWKQHLAVVLPCAYIAFRGGLAAETIPPWRRVAVTVAGCIIFLSRQFVVGRGLSIVLLSYKLDTLAILLLLLLALTVPTVRAACGVLPSIQRLRPAA